MSKQSRRPSRAAHHEQPSRAPAGRISTRTLAWFASLSVAAALVGASFLVGRGSNENTAGGPLKVGAIAPVVTGRNVVTGKELTAADLAGKDVLYYLSEGVMCQACLVQIQALQQHIAHLKERHLTLVSVTNDDAATLAQAARDYKITTPLIADTTRSITSTFGVLGGIPAGVGMHTDTADHTFVLVDRTGKVRFIEDYPKMWIDADELLGKLPKLS